MQMIDVLKRLNELDAANPNVKKPEILKVESLNKEMVNSPSLPPLNDMSELRALAGLKESQPIEECGMMPSPQSSGPASLNVSAGSAEELSHMLQDIMHLAGSPGPSMPGHDDSDSMQRMLDSMNEPQSEEILGALGGGLLGGAAGMATGGMGGAAIGALSGAAAGDSLTDPDADEVEEYSNSPADPTDVPRMDPNKMSHNPNQGDHRERQAGLPKGNPQRTMEQQLYAEYQKFITEAAKPDFLDMDKDGNKKETMKKAVADKKKGAVKEDEDKCNHTPKGEKCPVHGMKECSMEEGESHQAKTTMKHVKNPTPGEKKAAKDIKPGIAGYQDRVAMLKSAERDGRLKKS